MFCIDGAEESDSDESKKWEHVSQDDNLSREENYSFASDFRMPSLQTEEDMLREIDKLRAENGNKDAMHCELKMQNQTLKKKFAASEKEKKELMESNLRTNQEIIEIEKKKFQTEIMEAHNEKTSLKNEISDLKAKNSKLDKTLKGLVSERDDLKQRMETLSAEKVKLLSSAKEAEDLRAKVDALEERLEILKSENEQLTKLAAERDDLKQSLEALSVKNGELIFVAETTRRSLEEVASFKKREEQLVSEIDQLNAKVVEQKRASLELNLRVTECMEDKERAESKANELEVENAELCRKLEKLSSENMILTEQVDFVRFQQQTENNEKMNELTSVIQSRDSLKDEVKMLQEDNERLLKHTSETDEIHENYNQLSALLEEKMNELEAVQMEKEHFKSSLNLALQNADDLYEGNQLQHEAQAVIDSQQQRIKRLEEVLTSLGYDPDA